MRVEASTTINRSPEIVFQFVGVEHIANHPRWDPQMELTQITPGPIAIGTIVRRRHTRAGAPVEGTMECVEFDPPRALGWRIQDGHVLVNGRILVESDGPGRSRITLSADIPGMPNPLDPLPVQRSVDGIKALVEAETAER